MDPRPTVPLMGNLTHVASDKREMRVGLVHNHNVRITCICDCVCENQPYVGKMCVFQLISQKYRLMDLRCKFGFEI